MGWFKKLMTAVAEAIEEGRRDAKRTLCCGVLMHDLWQHATTCPQSLALDGKFAEWRDANHNADLNDMPDFGLRPMGDTSGLCPECGYPTGCFGIYTVGKACPNCRYVEKRVAKVIPIRRRRAR